jgi:hypothetical protein
MSVERFVLESGHSTSRGVIIGFAPQTEPSASTPRVSNDPLSVISR